MNFADIENAFFFVSFGDPYEHSALISRETGQIYYISELGDSDELPEDVEDEPEKYVAIPHKNDLGLGKRLVLSFVAESLPDEFETVERIRGSRHFWRRKAYSRLGTSTRTLVRRRPSGSGASKKRLRSRASNRVQPLWLRIYGRMAAAMMESIVIRTRCPGNAP